MINFRIIARVFSLLLIIEGLFMLASAAVSLIYSEHSASSLLYSALITMGTGLIVFTPLRNEERIFGNKEGYIIVTGIWVIFSLFGTLPYLLSGSVKFFGDALFESVSGFTTTGATIMTDPESLQKGILFWRSLTQWVGGLGIIFLSFSVFPVVRSINIQLASTEFSGQTTNKIHPRIKDAIIRLVTIYSILTISEMILLFIGGMSFFEAACHSFSTLSTGGFSTRNEGIAAFNAPYFKIVITLFMFIAGTNMTVAYFALKGNFKKISGNNEFVLYLITCFVFIILGSFFLSLNKGVSAGKAILDGAFHVVSIITTSGFYTENFNLWGNSMIIILFILMFTGGMSGSSSGGIKMVRLLLITKNNRQEMKRLIHPNAYIPVRLDKHIVQQSTIFNLLIFIILYYIVLCIGTFILSIFGYDLITSFSTSASMLANIGPGLGSYGPFTSYALMPMACKMLLAALMILGRLELLTVLLLFTRNFYSH